ADPTAGSVGIPENSIPQAEAVDFGIFLRQLNFRHRRAILGIEFINRAVDGFSAPQVAVVPSQAMRPDARPGYAADGFTGFRFNQVNLFSRWHGHPDLAIHPFQAVSAGWAGRLAKFRVPGAGLIEGSQGFAGLRIHFESLQRPRGSDPQGPIPEGD